MTDYNKRSHSNYDKRSQDSPRPFTVQVFLPYCQYFYNLKSRVCMNVNAAVYYIQLFSVKNVVEKTHFRFFEDFRYYARRYFRHKAEKEVHGFCVFADNHFPLLF